MIVYRKRLFAEGVNLVDNTSNGLQQPLTHPNESQLKSEFESKVRQNKNYGGNV